MTSKRGPAQRPRRERPERRVVRAARSRSRTAAGSRTRSRARRARASDVRQQRAGVGRRRSLMARRHAAAARRLRTTVDVLVRRDRREAGGDEHRQRARGSDRSPRCCRAALPRKRVDQRDAARGEVGERPRRAAPRRRPAGERRRDDEAHDRRGVVRRAPAIGGGAMRMRSQRVRQLVARLRVHPADDLVAGVREVALHLAASRCARPSPRRFMLAVERLPVERARHP